MRTQQTNNTVLYRIIRHILQTVSTYGTYICHQLGSFVLFFMQALYTLCNTPLQWHKLLVQIEHIGVGSLNIIILTGSFAGMVFALQSYIGFSRFGGEHFIGSVVALGMARELGPVLTGLMVTGRACSALAAELATMRVTEQIDALITLRINTFAYLIIPRLIAAVIVLPCLTLFATICGIIGGYAVIVHMLHLSSEQYVTNIIQLMNIHDVIGGLLKSAIFGLILAWVGCYKGYYARGGARGVGLATTQAVVLASVLILISNFFLTKLIDRL